MEGLLRLIKIIIITIIKASKAFNSAFDSINQLNKWLKVHKGSCFTLFLLVTASSRKLLQEMIRMAADSKTLFSCFQIPRADLLSSGIPNKWILDFRVSQASPPHCSTFCDSSGLSVSSGTGWIPTMAIGPSMMSLITLSLTFMSYMFMSHSLLWSKTKAAQSILENTKSVEIKLGNFNSLEK